jgi:hypothetical protein
MPGYKYPNIDSGATPIESASHAPNENYFQKTINEETRKIIFESIIGGKHQKH